VKFQANGSAISVVAALEFVEGAGDLGGGLELVGSSS
jgi:hypothetical protein